MNFLPGPRIVFALKEGESRWSEGLEDRAAEAPAGKFWGTGAASALTCRR